MIFFNISYHPNMLYFLIYYIIKRYIIPLYYINPIYYIIPIDVLYHRVKNFRYFEIKYCLREFGGVFVVSVECVHMSVECFWGVCTCLGGLQVSACVCRSLPVSKSVCGLYLKCLRMCI